MATSSTDAAAAPQWPDLPPELLRQISGRLDAGADLVRFLTVCRSWRDAHADRPPRFPPWQDLPPGVLRNISGRLHAAADFARFHAVCWPWHAALGRPPQFLPWLVAPSSDPAGVGGLADQQCRCVFSRTSSLAPGIICVGDRRVACADGTAGWLISRSHGTSLVDPLIAGLLPFSREDVNGKWPDRTHRTVSGDGAIFLYDFHTWRPGDWLPPGVDHPYSSLRGSFLRPGGQEWTFVYGGLSTDRCCAAVYFYGHIVCVDLANCYVIDNNNTQLELPNVPASKVRRCSYLLESTDDELLLASVLQDAAGTPGDLTVTLHALYPAAEQNGGEGPLVVEWFRRDDDVSLLGEDVMFLGFPGSFAVEADKFGGEVSSGTAYFVIDNSWAGGQGSSGSLGALPSCSVYRYSFHDGVSTLVETLPAGWNDGRSMWFLPRPKISRIPARRNRKCPGAPARIYAGDLPPKVDSARLREMFSVYGKVAGTRVAYDRKGRSRGFGFVTMATQQGFDKAMAALNAIEEPDDSFTILDWFIVLLILLLIFALFYFAIRVLCSCFF